MRYRCNYNIHGRKISRDKNNDMGLKLSEDEIITNISAFYAFAIIIAIFTLLMILETGLPTATLYMVWIFYALIYTRIVDGEGYETLGLKINPYSIGYFTIGVFLGFFLVTVVIYVMIMLGIAIISDNLMQPYYLINTIPFVLIQTSAEEIVFRGYPLKHLPKITDEDKAILLTAVIFSLMHTFNVGYNIIAFIFLLTAGYLLGKLYLSSGTLWVSIGFHLAWNLAEGPIYGTPVSGNVQDFSLFLVKLEGEWFLTGGEFGIEASIITVIIMAITVIIYHLGRTIKK